MIDSAARKVVDGYVPAYLLIPSFEDKRTEAKAFQDLVGSIVGYEVIANQGGVRYSDRFCWEINLAAKQIRVIDESMFDSKWNPIHTGGEMSMKWGLIAPDTTAAWWLEYFTTNK